jgi:hypothetical protein
MMHAGAIARTGTEITYFRFIRSAPISMRQAGSGASNSVRLGDQADIYARNERIAVREWASIWNRGASGLHGGRGCALPSPCTQSNKGGGNSDRQIAARTACNSGFGYASD